MAAKQRIKDSIEGVRDLVAKQMAEIIKNNANPVKTHQLMDLVTPKWHEDPRNY